MGYVIVNLLLDTCAILWIVADFEQLSEHARSLLTTGNTEVFFSPISCPEIACGVDRCRIQLDRHWKTWFRYFTELNGWTELPITLDITEEAYSLPDPFHQDPADRIIVATARLNSLVIVTGDRKILDYPHVESLR